MSKSNVTHTRTTITIHDVIVPVHLHLTMMKVEKKVMVKSKKKMNENIVPREAVHLLPFDPAAAYRGTHARILNLV